MRWNVLRWCAAVAVCGLCCCSLRAGDADAPAAKEAMRYDGKPFAYWRDYLRTELKDERRAEGIRAMAAFGTKGYATSASAAIVEVVKDYTEDAYPGGERPKKPEQQVIAEALNAVEKMGSPALDVFLQHANHPNVRTFVEHGSWIGWDNGSRIPVSPSALRNLIRAAQGDEAGLRHFAVGKLGRAMDGDERFKQEAVKAVLGEGQKFIQALIATAEEGPDWYSSHGLDAILKALGPRARAAIPSLVKAELRGGSWKEAIQSIEADPAPLVPLLTKGLTDEKASVRRKAAWWLGDLAAKAAPAIPALMRGLNDPDEEAREAVIRALGHVAAEPRLVVPPLIRIVSNRKDPHSF
jgi:hypothetical protein